MLVSRKSIQLLFAVVCLGLAVSTQAQEKIEYKGTSGVKLDVCQGQVRVLSQQQTDQGIDLDVEIKIAGCDGKCIGTLEYTLLFTDAAKNEITWELSDGWEWRDVKDAFTLHLHQKAPVNAKLKEVKSMKIGRCSCSTVVRAAE